MASSASASSSPLTAEYYKTMTPAFGEGPRYELIEGELVEINEMAGPNRLHQTISRNLMYSIEGFLREHALGDVYDAPFDVYLDDINVFQPDIVFISSANAPQMLRPEGVFGAPDLVIEILSPSTAHLDKQRKLPILARLGTRELWLIDPLLRQAQVYDLLGNPSRPSAIYEESDALETPLLPGLIISLREVFAQRFGA